MLSRTILSRAFMYDALVIGGGSGGVGCANELALGGMSVCCVDHVLPTPLGNSWGIGGTCVNVGCIPKKLMHYSTLKDPRIWAEGYGYMGSHDCVKHDWTTMQTNITNYIHSLNFKIRASLMKSGADFRPHFATFVDENTVLLSDGEEISARYIIIAAGMRPNYPDFPGSEHVVTSDDLFMFHPPPKDVLVVGGSVVALESAGVLIHDADNVSIMVRSVVLRGYDQECASFVRNDLEDLGGEKLSFIDGCVPTSIELIDGDEKKLVTYMDLETRERYQEIFDTVVVATGREPRLDAMNLPSGVLLDENGRIVVDDHLMRSEVENIYAIGDVNTVGPALTPVATKQGVMAARGILGETVPVIDWNLVPQTVFTPMEYGYCGLRSEDIAEEDDPFLSQYHQTIGLLEYGLTEQSHRQGLIKVIVDVLDDERVLGFHYIGPNAGEVTQGVAIGMRLGMTKGDLDETIGIHPTYAERMTTLRRGVVEDAGC